MYVNIWGIPEKISISLGRNPAGAKKMEKLGKRVKIFFYGIILIKINDRLEGGNSSLLPSLSLYFLLVTFQWEKILSSTKISTERSITGWIFF